MKRETFRKLKLVRGTCKESRGRREAGSEEERYKKERIDRL